MRSIIEYALARGCEVSTWTALIGYAGLQLSGQLSGAIAQAIAAIVCAALVAVKEHKAA